MLRLQVCTTTPSITKQHTTFLQYIKHISVLEEQIRTCKCEARLECANQCQEKCIVWVHESAGAICIYFDLLYPIHQHNILKFCFVIYLFSHKSSIKDSQEEKQGKFEKSSASVSSGRAQLLRYVTISMAMFSQPAHIQLPWHLQSSSVLYNDPRILKCWWLLVMSVKVRVIDFFKYIPGYTSTVALWITGSACYLLTSKASYEHWV